MSGEFKMNRHLEIAEFTSAKELAFFVNVYHISSDEIEEITETSKSGGLNKFTLFYWSRT